MSRGRGAAKAGADERYVRIDAPRNRQTGMSRSEGSAVDRKGIAGIVPSAKFIQKPEAFKKKIIQKK